MPILRLLRRALEEADRLTRLHFLGFTGLLVLLGATSADPAPPWPRFAGLLVVGLAFHVFAYVLNDVVDLPVDRGHPDRRRDPLVRGAVPPALALAAALAQIPLALAVAWRLRPDLPALALLGGAFAAMAVYDLWGKKCPLPPLTDAVQGVAWGCLTLWAAHAAGAGLSALSWTAAAYGCGFILLINGVHGGLRDLASDLGQGRRTTALFFGARPGARGVVPSGLATFARVGQGLLMAVSLAPLLLRAAGYGAAVRWAVLSSVAILDAAGAAWLGRVLRPGTATWHRDFRLHLVLLLLPLIALFLPRLDLARGTLLLLGFFTPLLLLDATRDALRAAFAVVSRRRATFG